jgi:hypothetical protein
MDGTGKSRNIVCELPSSFEVTCIQGAAVPNNVQITYLSMYGSGPVVP